MKTKYIFNLLALAMLMPAMLLTTACSNEDDVVNNTENIANKGYELPVTVNVTRQDAAATRATFDGSKLNFSTGDKLFVKGKDEGGVGFFAGTLTWQSGGTFSGTILTENAYSGTIDALFTAGSALATLLPADYGDYPYLSFTNEGTCSASLNYDITKTFATSKATAVEQFSFEVGGYTSGTGFALHPSNAILNFTITCLATNTGVNVAFKDNTDFTISENVTTNVSGTATFAIALYGSKDLNEFSLTVGGTPIPLVNSSKVLAAGKIYNINRAAFTMAADATSADKGKLICTDGHIHANGADNGCTKARVAKIIYLGTTDHDTYNHGLALALTDEGQMSWAAAKSTCSGKNTSTPVTSATWLLASEDQWKYMLRSNGAGSYSALRDGFSGITGASNLQSGDYWSSSVPEYSSPNARAFDFKKDEWSNISKDNNNIYVRACLAF